MTSILAKGSAPALRACLSVACGMVLLAGAALADPLEGMWQTTADDNGNSGLIQVTTCGTYLCGTLMQSFDASGAAFVSANIGRQIIFETVRTGAGTYTGQVHSPDCDATYNSRLTLSGNQLSVQGCWLGFCRNGGTWLRQ